MIVEKLLSFVPGNSNDPEKRTYLVVLYSFLAMIFLVVFLSVTFFFIFMKGGESVKMPDLSGMKLMDAMIELQKKKLDAKVKLKIYNPSNSEERGIVIGSDPVPGENTKTDSIIFLKISRGEILNRVPNYVGKLLSDVEAELSPENEKSTLLRIKRPIIAAYCDKPMGTIIGQKPDLNSPLTKLTELEFIVSKGSEGQKIRVRDYTGLEYDLAINRISKAGLPFSFKIRRGTGENNKSGVVLSQTPGAGEVVPMGTMIELDINPPGEVPDNMVFNLLEKKIDEWPVNLKMRAEVINPTGEKRPLFSFYHPGGEISFPYMLEKNSLIIVYVSDHEVFRYPVTNDN